MSAHMRFFFIDVVKISLEVWLCLERREKGFRVFIQKKSKKSAKKICDFSITSFFLKKNVIINLFKNLKEHKRVKVKTQGG